MKHIFTRLFTITALVFICMSCSKSDQSGKIAGTSWEATIQKGYNYVKEEPSYTTDYIIFFDDYVEYHSGWDSNCNWKGAYRYIRGISEIEFFDIEYNDSRYKKTLLDRCVVNGNSLIATYADEEGAYNRSNNKTVVFSKK